MHYKYTVGRLRAETENKVSGQKMRRLGKQSGIFIHVAF